MEKDVRQVILDSDKAKLSNAEIAKKLGISEAKVYAYRREFKVHKTDQTDSVFMEFKRQWIEETELYWKSHESRPKDMLTAMCIARYGEKGTSELFTAWTLLRNRNGMLYRYLLEEYV